MRITAIEKTKKGRFSVYADGAYLFSLHPDIYAVSNLSVDDAVDVQRLEALRLQSEEKDAREKALRILGRSAQSKGRVYGKLRQGGCSEEAAAAAVSRMEELGLLNDRDYALRLARDLLNLRHYALDRVEQELMHRGVEPQAIGHALEALAPAYDPVAQIAALCRRKYTDINTDEKSRRRCVNALMRLGYRYGDIREALRFLQDDSHFPGAFAEQLDSEEEHES